MKAKITKVNSKILLSILSIVLSVLIYLFVSILEKNKEIKIDYSYGNSTSYSDITADVLDNLRYQVKVYLISDEAANDQILMNLLERFQTRSKNFKIIRESIYSNPLLLHKISDSLKDSDINTKSVVLFCEETGRTRVLSTSDFVFKQINANTNNLDTIGIQYEKSISEALVYLVSDKLPVIQRLIGHDEINDDSFKALSKLLKSKYYEIKDVDLSRGDELMDQSVLLILSPRKDFSEVELEKLKKYIDNGGNIIISSDYSDPSNLKNFNKLLEYYGLKIKPGIVVCDAKDTASYYKSQIILLPYMQNNEFTSELIANNKDKLMLAGSRAFEKIDSVNSVKAYSLLKVEKSFIRPYKGENTNLKQTDNDTLEENNLAYLARRFSSDGKVSHAVVIGNSATLIDDWLFENTFSVDFIMQVLNYFNPNSHSSSLAIEPKYIVKSPLIVKSFAVLVLVMALPLCIIIFISIYIKSKRKNHARKL